MSLNRDGQGITLFSQPGGEQRSEEKKTLSIGKFQCEEKFRYKEDEYRNAFSILWMSSPGKSFGTASIRHLVELSLKNNKFKGNVCAPLTIFSSHIFYLKMGFIPIDVKEHKLVKKYGADEALALICLKENKLESLNNFLINFRYILGTENRIPNDKTITIDDVLEHRKFLISLVKENYIKGKFIPTLLTILENNIGNNRPKTQTFFEGITMVLSSVGLSRWKDAIEKNTDFKPFRNYEQLWPHMTVEQITRLENILLQHNSALTQTMTMKP